MNVAKGTIEKLLQTATFHPERYALWMGIVYNGKGYNGMYGYDFCTQTQTLVLHPKQEIIYALKETPGQITLIQA